MSWLAPPQKGWKGEDVKRPLCRLPQCSEGSKGEDVRRLLNEVTGGRGKMENDSSSMKGDAAGQIPGGPWTAFPNLPRAVVFFLCFGLPGKDPYGTIPVGLGRVLHSEGRLSVHPYVHVSIIGPICRI